MYMYCLYCLPQRCEAIARLLGKMLPCKAFSPKIVQRKWKKGKAYEEVKACLPGYVFLYCEEKANNILDLKRISGVVKVLHQDGHSFELTGDDEKFALMLYQCGGTIGLVKTYREGDRVMLHGDLMSSFNGQIVKLDHRHKRAQIRFEFDHIVRYIWAGYEMITSDLEEE